ncbi:hypothetical protein ACWOB4_09360 [Enterococcus songbeiensis]
MVEKSTLFYLLGAKKMVKIDCLNAIKLEPQVIRKKLISYFGV